VTAEHGPALPEHCASCRKVHAVRLAFASDFPGVRMANVLVADRCALSVRVVQTHTAHLIRHRQLTPDGMPAPGAVVADGGPVPQDATPVQWAGCQGGLAAGPRRLLLAYARNGWAGRVALVELAAVADMSERTARTHRADLVARVLLETRRSYEAREGSAYPRRLADTYRLMPGRDVVLPRLDVLNESAGAAAVGQARQIVDAVWWYSDAPAQLARAYALVAELLLKGWPPSVLAAAVGVEPRSFPVRSPFGLLRTLLPNDWEDYRPSAREVVRGEIDAPAVGLVDCPHCDRPSHPGPRMDAHVAACRARQSATPDVPVTDAMRAFVGSLAVPA
jgi:hypothetical protein